MAVNVGFVVDKMTLGQVILQVLQFLPVSIIPHYFKLSHSYIELTSYQLTVSFKKWVYVLARSFHIHISVHNSDKYVKATKK